MALKKAEKLAIVEQFGGSSTNTGSTMVQVAILTKRIQLLTEHIKVNKKDYSSKRGLFKLVSQRRRFLSYLKRKNINQYRDLVKALGLRG